MAAREVFLPPDKFGLVEPQVYRAAFPAPEHFGHLRQLSIRTVVNLSQEALTRGVLGFFQESGVHVADVGLQVWTHPMCAAISTELVKEAMRFVLDRTHHPLLILSSSGTHQVGALVGCLRRLQRWNLAATLDEYRSYAAPTSRLACEQFIELWDCDLLTLPALAEYPVWFERQQRLLEDDRERWLGERDARSARPARAAAGALAGADPPPATDPHYFRVTAPLAAASELRRVTVAPVADDD